MTKISKRSLDRNIAKVSAKRKQQKFEKSAEAKMEKLKKAAASAQVKAKKLTIKVAKTARRIATNAPGTMEKFKKWQKKMKKYQDPMWRQSGW